MRTLVQDLRYAFRNFSKRPGFTAAAVLTLALAIGAATVVFDLFNLFVWQKPPIESPDEMVQIYRESNYAFIGLYGWHSVPDFEDLRAAASSLQDLAASTYGTQVTLDTGETTELVNTAAVSGNYFSFLGLGGAGAGRLLAAPDDEPGTAPTVVLSAALWHRLFGEDPSIVGRTVKINGVAATVLGVGPSELTTVKAGDRPDLWIPLAHAPSLLDPIVDWREDRNLDRLALFGRLREGVSVAAAQAEIDGLAARLDAESPLPERERRLTVAPMTLAFAMDRERAGPMLRLFGAAVALLLLLACANVANLLLAREASRRSEMAMRLALGASRGRLVRQLLTESLLLALVGGGLGLLAAAWARELLVLFLSEELVVEMRFDHRVLGAGFLVCLGVSLLFGLAPALRASRVDLIQTITSAATGEDGRRRLGTGDLLVMAQVALSVVLLVASGLLASTLWNLRSSELGFSGDGIAAMRLDLSQGRYTRETGPDVYARLRDRAAALPGVRSASIAILLPPVLLDLSVPLRLPEEPDVQRSSRFNFVDGHYFDTLGIPLLEGRTFDSRDMAGPEVDGPEGGAIQGTAIVSRALADELWPTGGIVGRRIRVDSSRPGEPTEYEIVGMVGDIVQHDLRLDAERLRGGRPGLGAARHGERAGLRGQSPLAGDRHPHGGGGERPGGLALDRRPRPGAGDGGGRGRLGRRGVGSAGLAGHRAGGRDRRAGDLRGGRLVASPRHRRSGVDPRAAGGAARSVDGPARAVAGHRGSSGLPTKQ